jgi:hypothetical protein
MPVELRAETAPATYAAALLAALARDEAAGRASARLTEPGLATWQRFRGRLGSADLLRLLIEDGAVLHPVPFAAAQLGIALDDLDDALVDSWLAGLGAKDLRAQAAAYVESQAQLLGVPTKLARSELHQVKPHQKVLELPDPRLSPAGQPRAPATEPGSAGDDLPVPPAPGLVPRGRARTRRVAVPRRGLGACWPRRHRGDPTTTGAPWTRLL